MLLQVPSRTGSVGRRIHRIFWKASGVFIYPISASNWKGRTMSLCWSQGEIAMKLCHSVRLWKGEVCQGCSSCPKAYLGTLSGLMGQPRRSAQRSASEVLPSGSALINLPWFCPWFIDISSPNSSCLKVHWSFRGDEECPSQLTLKVPLHRKKWVFTDHAEHTGSQFRLFLQDWS